MVIGAAAAIIAAGLLFFYVPVPQPWSGWWFPHLPRAYYLIGAVLVATLLYLAVYGAFWVLARCGGGRLYAALMNRVIQGGVMGAVYGDDAQYKVTGISGSPLNLTNPKDVHLTTARLGGVDENAVLKSAHRIYEEILSDEASKTGVSDPRKFWKHLSEALYHNAYMLDPEIIACVADHMAWGSRGGET